MSRVTRVIVLVVVAMFVLVFTGKIDLLIGSACVLVLGMFLAVLNLVDVMTSTGSPGRFEGAMLALGILCVVSAFGFFFVILSERDPSAFTERLSLSDAMYFSLVTMTTTGYGDIAPKSDAARIAVSAELGLTVTVIAIALARIGYVIAGGGSDGEK